ncbi:7-cyano-7-deazaguanine synthase QueC [Thauera linaloolentis]|uniref:7-cyano-7-deazaguanine synthase n=1 Tax=Thauera linaloolentis (strain DSM 12138 / JCM 21573 / CCUG 41526 / CIP 105981 / IAM 15112 / NBRC 102519 / 47Lol) TaxID=1123367 RepID=N6Z5G2_THAL4|nr:7-cyano-7-deazaguanine synthase QueC [Thauera linaloolentis]ENO89663.1 exsB protein [Thauera linaloolentis 47Lol = DSM 12138]MCM8567143.1 7-cyano-7-deazaguanine synthase QueC [Thauera linaloolentis]
MTPAKRAVVLLSGGLDSATCLAIARDMGFETYALSVAYGQRHAAELTASLRVAQALGAKEHRLARINLGQFGGSALTDPAIDIPEALPGDDERPCIPVTYVPARNTVMLSIAMAWAEVLGANDIFIGVNAVDYSGYPDCRPAFIQAFEAMANLATKAGIEGAQLRIHAPLIESSKADIIRRGIGLGVDYGITVTCYQADDAGRACGRCEACRLRAMGFAAADVPDPTPYQLRND